MRLSLLSVLGLAGLAACATNPLPPQVASSPVAYAYPTARSGASPTAPIQATPVVDAPAAASSKKVSFVAEPVVVVAPSYRLPSDAPLSR